MARGLPALFTTRSGRPLAKKVAKELTELMQARLHEYVETVTHDKKEEAEIAKINQIRAQNVRYFGRSNGALFPRHMHVEDFSDGEIHVVIDDYQLGEGGPIVANSVRGQDVFLIAGAYEPPRDISELIDQVGDKLGSKQRTNQFLEELVSEARKDRSINDNLKEALIALRTLAICDAERVTWISPTSPYARQDRSKEREASIAKLVQEFSEVCRASHAVFVDLHADQIKSFYQNRFQTADNVQASVVLQPGLARMMTQDGVIDPKDFNLHYVFESPDAGAMKRVRWYANRFGIDLVYADKMRNYSIPNSVAKVVIIGDVNAKYSIIVDDLLDTGGTLTSIARETVARGAKGVYFGAAHGLMTGPAIGRLDELYAEGILKGALFTDSVHRSKEFAEAHQWFNQVSIARPMAELIYNSTMEKSVSGVYDSERTARVVTFPEN